MLFFIKLVVILLQSLFIIHEFPKPYLPASSFVITKLTSPSKQIPQPLCYLLKLNCTVMEWFTNLLQGDCDLSTAIG